MSKQSKKAQEFVERLAQARDCMELLAVELDNEMGCVRDQAVLVLRGGLMLSKFVKTTARYVDYVRKSSIDHGDEVVQWWPVWEDTEELMRSALKGMKRIVWEVSTCSYKGTPYYMMELDEVSGALVGRGKGLVDVFQRLARQEADYVSEVRALAHDEVRPAGMRLLPQNFNNDRARKLLMVCVRQGWLDENFRPQISQSKTAILAFALNEELQLSPAWPPFEKLWGIGNLANIHCRALERNYYADTLRNYKQIIRAS